MYYTCPRRLGTIHSSLARGMRHRHMIILKSVTFTMTTGSPPRAPPRHMIGLLNVNQLSPNTLYTELRALAPPPKMGMASMPHRPQPTTTHAGRHEHDPSDKQKVQNDNADSRTSSQQSHGVQNARRDQVRFSTNDKAEAERAAPNQGERAVALLRKSARPQQPGRCQAD